MDAREVCGKHFVPLCVQCCGVRAVFHKMRFDKSTHLGLGDIRLSIGVQEEIVAEIERLRAEVAELKEDIECNDVAVGETLRIAIDAARGKR